MVVEDGTCERERGRWSRLVDVQASPLQWVSKSKVVVGGGGEEKRGRGEVEVKKDTRWRRPGH